MDIETNLRANGGTRGLAALKPSKYSGKYFKKEVNRKCCENVSANKLEVIKGYNGLLCLLGHHNSIME
jgi:hypothetical protein